MLYIHDKRDIRLEQPSVVTIGKFDGFHRGHRKLLKAARKLCGPDRQLVVFTFSRSPQMVLSGQQGTELNCRQEKLLLAEELGVDVLVEYPFTDDVRRMEAEDFLRDILCHRLNAREIVAGPDCCFGYERRGNIELLRKYEEELGYRAHVIEKEMYRFRPISSTRIREALTAGNMPEVNDMLGYDYGICASVEHGKQLGRTLGFPTINQRVPEGKAVPAFGVYASRVKVDGQWLPAISNVGTKPTVSGDTTVGIETSIFDYRGDLYGRMMEVCLLSYVRPEQKFPSLEALRRQVEKDKDTVRRYFRQEDKV